MSQDGGTTLENSGTIGAIALDGGTAISSTHIHYKGFAPESLHPALATIIEHHQKGRAAAALAQIEVLTSLPHEDPKAQISVDIVSFYLNLLSGNKIEDARIRISEYLRNHHKKVGDLLVDLCISALIRLDVKIDDLESARATAGDFSQYGNHSAEAFYELIANREELEEAFIKYNHDSFVLFGVVNGAIRLRKGELAQRASERLFKISPSEKHQVVCFVAKYLLISHELNARHYWCLPYDLYNQLMELAALCETLLSSKPLLDKRLPVIGTSIIQYMLGASQGLIDACAEYLDIIENDHSELAVRLKYLKDGCSDGLTEFELLMIKAENDTVFRQEKTKEYLGEPTFTEEVAIFVSQFSNSSDIAKWFSSGGTVSSESELTQKLVLILLKAASLPVNSRQSDTREIKTLCADVLGSYNDQWTTINPPVLVRVCRTLGSIGEAWTAAQFIRPLLPENTEIWPSPLVALYLDLLVDSEQWASVRKVINNIPEFCWNTKVCEQAARLEISVGDENKARKILEHSLSIKQNDSCLNLLCYTLRRLGDHGSLKILLEKIPVEFFSDRTVSKCHLVLEMLSLGIYDLACRILYRWFVDNPDGSAYHISSILTGLFSNPEINPWDTRIGRVKGVQYRDGKTKIIKLVVPCQDVNGQYCIDEDSDVGKALASAKKGDSIYNGPKEYIVEEILPPVVAISRIASDIRDKSNQGDDPFHILSIEDDNVQGFLDQINRMNSDRRNGDKNVAEHECFPVMMKGKILGNYSVFGTALGVFSDCNVIKNPLPNENIDKFPEKILLDVYALAYLVNTGIALSLVKSGIDLYICETTKLYAGEWFKERNVNGGVLASLGDEPVFVSIEEIRRDTEKTANILQILIENCRVLEPKEADFPESLLFLVERVDGSVFSTIRLASAWNIPWLCVDDKMAIIVAKEGCPVVTNALRIINNLSLNIVFPEKRDGIIRHALKQCYFPIGYKDLEALIKENRQESYDVVSILLRMHFQAFSNNILCSYFIVSLWNIYLSGAFENIQSIEDVRFPIAFTKLANTIFWVSITNNPEEVAEHKLAEFLLVLVKKIHTYCMPTRIENMIISFLNQLANRFVVGHFLDVDVINNKINGDSNE